MSRTEFGRRQGHQRGWLRIAGRPRLPCTVHDISLRGAMLELDVPPWLPLRFELSLDVEPRLFQCELKHAGERSVRVTFCARSAEGAKNTSSGPVEEWMGPNRNR